MINIVFSCLDLAKNIRIKRAVINNKLFVFFKSFRNKEKNRFFMINRAENIDLIIFVSLIGFCATQIYEN